MQILTSYILSMILSISPASQHPDETAAEYQARAHEIAEDIALVTQGEAPIFDGEDEEHYKSATLIAALAFWESNFQIFVDAGVCNSADKMRAWVKTHLTGWVGACDGTIAVSMWQVHAEGGFFLEPNEGWRWPTSKDAAGDIWTRKDMLRSRRAAIRVALHIARQSIHNGAGLIQYTGEASGFEKARARLDFARRWWTTHPLPPAPAEETQDNE
jgi:hypothetical protein